MLRILYIHCNAVASGKCGVRVLVSGEVVCTSLDAIVPVGLGSALGRLQG